MLQKAFANLYTALIALFDKQPPQQVPLALYKQSIFNPAGLWTLLMALGLVLVFYFVVNGQHTATYLKDNGKPTVGKWLLTLLLAAGIGAWLAYYIGLTLGAAREPYLRYFIVVNMGVAAVWFGLASLVAKLNWLASHARSTPF